MFKAKAAVNARADGAARYGEVAFIFIPAAFFPRRRHQLLDADQHDRPMAIIAQGGGSGTTMPDYAHGKSLGPLGLVK